MRTLLLTLVIAPIFSFMGFAQTAQTAEKPATIEGRVLDAATGAPLRKTALTLRPAGGQQGRGQQGGPQGTVQQQAGALRDAVQGALGNPRRQYSATTDAQGRFSITVDQSGDFRLSADRTGYVRGEYGSRRPGAAGRTVHFDAGQRLTGIDVRMTPQGIIAGRVVDEDGDPVERAQINITTKPDAMGSTRSSSTVTNDLGEFRVAGLAAGRYYVLATRIGLAQQDDAAAGQETWAVTYFPGVTDAASATPISVTPGQQMTGIFITMRKTRVFRVTGLISGSVGDDNAQQPQQAQGQQGQPGLGGRGGQQPNARQAIRAVMGNRVIVNLNERAESVGPNIGRRLIGTVNADGTFQVPNVPPGSYWAVATLQSQRGALTVGRTAVDIRNANVSGIVVGVAPPVVVNGTVRPDGREALTITGNVQFTPVVDGPANTTNAPLQANGTFQTPALSRTRYRVAAAGLPDGMYLKAVRVGGVDVTKAGVDLSTAPASFAVELTFSAKAASVAGTVKFGKENLPGRVLLVPDPYNPAEFAVPAQAGVVGVPTTVNDAGAFTLKNVPPGNYRLYAFEDVDFQNLDANLLRRLESRAEKLSLNESASPNVELKQIPAEDSAE